MTFSRLLSQPSVGLPPTSTAHQSIHYTTQHSTTNIWDTYLATWKGIKPPASVTRWLHRTGLGWRRRPTDDRAPAGVKRASGHGRKRGGKGAETVHHRGTPLLDSCALWLANLSAARLAQHCTWLRSSAVGGGRGAAGGGRSPNIFLIAPVPSAERRNQTRLKTSHA